MFDDYLARIKERRAADAKRYAELDEALCMICGAYGADKRSFWLSCFYAVNEVVPEVIDTFDVPDMPERMRGFYYLRICKVCRGNMLGKLKEWRDEGIAKRGMKLDHDGYVEDDEAEGCVPVRINGMVVMMTLDEYQRWDAKRTALAATPVQP